MLEEHADELRDYDLLYVVNAEAVPRTFKDAIALGHPLAGRLYTKPEHRSAVLTFMEGISADGRLDRDELEARVGEAPKSAEVDILNDGKADMEDVSLPDSQHSLLYLLAQEYRICLVPDPSIAPLNTPHAPRGINYFDELGLVWVDTSVGEVKFTKPDRYHKVPTVVEDRAPFEVENLDSVPQLRDAYDTSRDA